MASILEQAIAQFDARPIRSIEIPEWGEAGKPAVIHYKSPPLAVLSRVRKEAGDDEVKQSAMLVAQCALDAEGNRIFTNMAWQDLFKSVDPVVVQRIGAAIMEDFLTAMAAPANIEKN